MKATDSTIAPRLRRRCRRSMTSCLTSTLVSTAGTESAPSGRTLIVPRTFLVSNLTMITPDATMTIEEYVDAYDPVSPVLRMTYVFDES